LVPQLDTQFAGKALICFHDASFYENLPWAIYMISAKGQGGILPAKFLEALNFCMVANPVNISVSDKAQSSAGND
jgi:hypothetical protein